MLNLIINLKVFLKIYFVLKMKHYHDEWIQEWCQENGWTDLFTERSLYWAFPPGAVMPEPIPVKVLKLIKEQKGLCQQERVWLILAAMITVVTVVSSLLARCPVPLVLAFAFNAIAVAKIEPEFA
jgi:hypothetical protein